MIKVDERSFCLQPTDSLEILERAIGARSVFCDVETTAFCDDRFGNKPYAGDRICGFSLTWDDMPHSYYVPLRHHNPAWNLDPEKVMRIMKPVLTSCHEWSNPNVKFDAHFFAIEGAEFNCRLVDITNCAKLIDSDRQFRGGYGEDALARDWLDRDIKAKEDEINKYLAHFKKGNKACRDYAKVPADVMARYACEDTLTGRDLHHHMLRVRDPVLNDVWETEILLTPVLYDMEKAGLRVEPDKLLALEYQLRSELAMVQEEIHKLTGLSIEAHNTGDCYELLCNHFGLPVLGWTEDDDGKPKNPSFAADVLVKYEVHPQVIMNEKRAKILKLMKFYRERHTLLTLFVSRYLEKHVNGVLHPSYNQSIRTGRMSGKDPNPQQLSTDAKALIIPEKDCAFLSMDESQIEFRVIVHYIRDESAIKAYNEDPETDFHDFVAKECQIPRKPAKTVNFTVGYGGGKKKTVTTLTQTKELVEALVGESQRMLEDPDTLTRCQQIYRSRHGLTTRDPVDIGDLRRDLFEALCWKRGEHVYNTYHARFPGIKTEADIACYTAKSRGYVKTIDGRKRYLPPNAAWRAFNTVCQGSAADIMKYVTVQCAPRYNSDVRATGIDIRAQVHDENLFHGSREATRDPKIVAMLAKLMETPRHPLRVPIRVGAGWSDVNWDIASDAKKGKIPIDRSLA